jgi:hypothetical protein
MLVQTFGDPNCKWPHPFRAGPTLMILSTNCREFGAHLRLPRISGFLRQGWPSIV